MPPTCAHPHPGIAEDFLWILVGLLYVDLHLSFIVSERQPSFAYSGIICFSVLFLLISIKPAKSCLIHPINSMLGRMSVMDSATRRYEHFLGWTLKRISCMADSSLGMSHEHVSAKMRMRQR